MPRAFISYATKDAIFSDLARMKLEEGGVDVWLDQGALRVGEEWRKAIDEGIAQSDVVLVVLTPCGCDSPYVTYEWAFALGKGIKVIPLLREDAKIHPRLDVLQYLDFRNQKDLPWPTLLTEIARSASNRDKKGESYVSDLKVEQLQELITAAVSLAAATAKVTGKGTDADDISRAAKSVATTMQPAYQVMGEHAQKHLLWVDDRPENNVYERKAFESIGFTFTLALSTAEAMENLSGRSFAAIISDMGRREGPREGYVLLDALRSKGDQSPFFIYAGSNTPEHKREAAELGAQGSTNSPQELFDLVTRVV